MSRSTIVTSGLVGLLAALATGTGEFILHFDALARFGPENQFFLGISDQRLTLGHFIGVIAAPLYLVGAWHIREMLKPASERWSLIAFLLTAYGFAVGAVWIGSRATLGTLINSPDTAAVEQMLSLYDFRYETLLQVIRIAVLVLSGILIWLILGGRSHYPKWMVALNPILLIIASFVVYAIAPGAGKYLMPIALNVAFFVFFLVSTTIAVRKGL